MDTLPFLEQPWVLPEDKTMDDTVALPPPADSDHLHTTAIADIVRMDCTLRVLVVVLAKDSFWFLYYLQPPPKRSNMIDLIILLISSLSTISILTTTTLILLRQRIDEWIQRRRHKYEIQSQRFNCIPKQKPVSLSVHSK